MAWHTCHVHYTFSVLIMFTQRQFHKYFITKESIISPVSIRCLAYSSTFWGKEIRILFFLVLIFENHLKNHNMRNNNNHISINSSRWKINSQKFEELWNPVRLVGPTHWFLGRQDKTKFTKKYINSWSMG